MNHMLLKLRQQLVDMDIDILERNCMEDIEDTEEIEDIGMLRDNLDIYCYLMVGLQMFVSSVHCLAY